MKKKIYKFFLIIIFVTLIFPTSLFAYVDLDVDLDVKITSVKENIFSGRGVRVEGKSYAGSLMYVSIYDDGDNLIHSLKTTTDALGNWLVNFDQPLKKGKYYIEAKVQNSNGLLGAPTRSYLIDVRGPFALIIVIFSLLVAIFMTAFVSIWYLSKRAEIKRYQRILITERDIDSSYKIMKKDVQKALKKISDGKLDEGAIGEIEFLLKKTDENLEKMSKYITKGINILSKYDIIAKIDKINKA